MCGIYNVECVSVAGITFARTTHTQSLHRSYFIETYRTHILHIPLSPNRHCNTFTLCCVWKNYFGKWNITMPYIGLSVSMDAFWKPFNVFVSSHEKIYLYNAACASYTYIGSRCFWSLVLTLSFSLSCVFRQMVFPTFITFNFLLIFLFVFCFFSSFGSHVSVCYGKMPYKFLKSSKNGSRNSIDDERGYTVTFWLSKYSVKFCVHFVLARVYEQRK